MGVYKGVEPSPRLREASDAKLPQMMIHVQIGVPHSLFSGHFAEKSMRRELALKCAEAV